VTSTPDDIDWEDEIRLVIEERASFSTDALTGMEANLRFAGRETPETKVFSRLTAWQNWIFQRPNAAGPEGALRRYGTGKRTAIAVGRDGWAHFDRVPMEEYRWGIFLAERDPDRKVNFGDKLGEPAWQEVPGEHARTCAG
jgi:hypothetical protein